MPRSPRQEFLDSPGGMCLYIVFLGLTAGSSSTPPWVRVVAAVFLMAWVTLLVKQLLRRGRGRRRSASERLGDSAP